MKDKDETVSLIAGKVLRDSGKLKREHVPALTDALKNGSPDGRTFALRLLVGLAPKSPDAAAAIVAAVADKNRDVRIEAVEALGELGPKAFKAAPALAKLLTGEDAKAKKAAIVSLGKIGPKAEDAAPAIVGLLKDKALHDDASAALLKIGKGSVAALLEALDSAKDFKVRVELVTLLGEIGPDAEDAIKPLEDLLEEERLPGVRTALKTALAKIRKKK